MLSRYVQTVAIVSLAALLLIQLPGYAQTDDLTQPAKPQALAPLVPLNANSKKLSSAEQTKLTQKVYQLTKTASKLSDFATIADQCQFGLDRGLNQKNADYLLSLQGWALNRCGEKRVELAVELKRIGSHNQAEKNFAEALENFLQATISAPQRHRTWNSWGTALVYRGEYRAALEKFDEATRRKTDYVAAWFNRAETYSQLNQFDKAINDYTFVLRMNSKDIESLNGRGLAYLGAEQPDDALADFEKAISLGAENANLLVNCGDAKSASGQWKAALDDYARASTMDTSSAGDQRAAWVLATCPDDNLRDGKRAIALIEASLKRGNRTAEALETLAAARASIGEFDKACQNQEQAIALVSAEVEPTDESPIKVRLALYQSEKPFVEDTSKTREEK